MVSDFAVAQMRASDDGFEDHGSAGSKMTLIRIDGSA
jgi:hypothetical protein